jgi:hypothetical protein
VNGCSQNDNWVQCLNGVPVTFGNFLVPRFFLKRGFKKKKKKKNPGINPGQPAGKGRKKNKKKKTLVLTLGSPPEKGGEKKK